MKVKRFCFFIAITFLLFILAYPVVGQDQQSGYITVVKLKDGSVIEGTLTEFRDGEFIKMRIGENEITLKYESIRNIKHKNRSFNRTYSFSENGLYHHSSLGLLPGFISAGNPVLGVQIDHSSGWLFHRLLGAGLNLGISNYDPQSREVFYTLAGEIRGYLLSQGLSPYYALRGGYGFTHRGSNFLEARGGYYLHPALGLRFSGWQTGNVTAELGMAFQKAHFKQQTEWWDRSIIEKDVRYQRITLKIGIQF